MHKDNEVRGIGNSLDFGARIYDSRLGRFLSLDPYANKFPGQSPYVFAGNSPILNIDKNGEYKYPKNKASEYTNEFPMITKYLSEYIERDIRKSTTIQNAIVKHSYGGFTKSELVGTVAKWNDPNSPEITFEKGLFDRTGGNAIGYTPNSKGFQIDWDYAKAIEDIMSSNKYSKEDKHAALFKFYETVLHETTHVGDLKDRFRSADEVGSDDMNEIFHIEKVKVTNSEGKAEMVDVYYDFDIDAGHYDVDAAKRTMDRKREGGQSDVLPTLPASTK